MKRIAVAIAALLAATEAIAVPRPDTTSMTCANVQGVIQRQGAAILRYRSPRTGAMLYDRFVKDRSYCQASEDAAPASVPTADRNACPVRKCAPGTGNDQR